MMTDELEKYIEKLCKRHPTIREIWLFGSRANNSAHKKSDWDFFVFGGNNLFNSIKGDTSVHRMDVDLLIVNENNQKFKKPWGDNRKGSLTEWNWTKISKQKAHYTATKWIEDEDAKEEGITDEGTLICKQLIAYQIWPKHNHIQ